MHKSEEIIPPNRVSDLFTNKTILITGATGFLGTLLIEKLLRSCTSLKKIYVIIRSKTGKSFKERLTKLLSRVVFDNVKELQGGEILDKVEAISGDISELDLALCENDRRKLCEETEIIYHLADSARFDEALRFMVLLNLRGTKLMLDLAKECKKLMAFCYISTAYCHESQEVLYDNTVYAPPAEPQKILQITDYLDENALNYIAKYLRGTSGNNYTFTKALAEALVYEQMDKFPAIIQRPSYVVPTWREPISGWTNNLGLIDSAGMGVLRTIYAKSEMVLDFCPADVIVNMLICSTYNFLTYGSRRVYNLTNSREMEISIREVVDVGMDITTTKIPSSRVLWYPNVTLTRYRFLYYIYFFLFQLLPALLIDVVLTFLRLKPFLLKMQGKIWRSCQVFEYYSSREWDFRNDNFMFIRNYLNSTKKRVFKIYFEGFDFREFCIDCFENGRVGSNKNKVSDLRKIQILKYVLILCKTIFFCGLFYFIFKLVDVVAVLENY